jgi:DNA-directed RNA polymerase specialized sigma24 family protein
VKDVEDDSFEAFVAERSTALLRTAYLLTAHRGQAEDLLETALIGTQQRWEQIADHEEAMAFARRAIVGLHVGWRRWIRLGDLLDDVPMVAGMTGRRPDTGRRGATIGALARMAPRTRAVLVLRFWEDLSEAATAEAVGSSVDAIRLHTARGLEQVRDGTGGADADPRVLLRRDLAERAGDVAAAPDDAYARVLDGRSTQRRHLAGLLAVAVFLAVVTLLVVLTVGNGDAGPAR